MRSRTAILTLSLMLVVASAFAGETVDEKALVRDQNAFAMALYHALPSADGNVFLSPYSISTALAMTYAGARGSTEAQMAKSLRFSLSQSKLHPAFASLEARVREIQASGNVELRVANSIWPAKGYKFQHAFLSLLKRDYDASITPIDYGRTEAARSMINGWVEKKTHRKIRNLIPRGGLDPRTRMTIVDAIYFYGKWKRPFSPRATSIEPFHRSSRSTLRAPLMRKTDAFGYAENADLQILELPYVGGEISMLVVLPKSVDGLAKIERRLTAANFDEWVGMLNEQEVRVSLPKFETAAMVELRSTLESMGMTDAFNPARADFSGMTSAAGSSEGLYIGAVYHKAYVDVKEEGTTAAAATGVTMMPTAMRVPVKPPPVFRADHPFLFFIRDAETGSILFIGRIVDPGMKEE